MRGLSQQAKANEALAEENRALGEQLNALSGKAGAEEAVMQRMQVGGCGCVCLGAGGALRVCRCVCVCACAGVGDIFSAGTFSLRGRVQGLLKLTVAVVLCGRCNQ